MLPEVLGGGINKNYLEGLNGSEFILFWKGSVVLYKYWDGLDIDIRDIRTKDWKQHAPPIEC